MTRDEWLTFAAVVQAIGAVASVVIAIVAVVLALKANRMNKDAMFVPRIIAALFDCMVLARFVRAQYCALFSDFKTEAEKLQAHFAWLAKREEVLTTLTEMSGIFDEIAPALSAWEKVEEEENPHVYSQALTVAEKTSEDAKKKYDRIHNKFVAEIGHVIRGLRTAEIKPTKTKG